MFCDEPAMLILLDAMLFMEEEPPAMLLPPLIMFGAMLLGVILFMLFGAMLFMELVCIICGALVVIMEPDIVFPICGVSSACRASGSAKASEVNDSLSLVIVFILYFQVYWLVVGW